MTGNVVYSLFRRRINFIIMKRFYLFFIVLSGLLAQGDFNDGPYGSEYFDIAGPFHIRDLNNDNDILGDVNYDSNLNVEDVIIVIGIILSSKGNEV